MATATRDLPDRTTRLAKRSVVPEDRSVLEGDAGLALAAVRAAALACIEHVGGGDRHGADGAATAAMRQVLDSGAGLATVVVGEGEKDEAPMLWAGEQLGRGDRSTVDVAVDPLEGTKACAAGLPGALATIALASPGSLWRAGRSFYLDKLVAGPAARGALDITRPAAWNVAAVAEALGKPVPEVRVVILDKPRHHDLVAKLRDLGVTVATPPDGDVAAALSTLLPDGAADLLIGIGGTPEGVMTACAVEALVGEMQARPAPQRAEEERSLRHAGISLNRVLHSSDIAPAGGIFAACGISGGELLRAPWRQGRAHSTESLLISHNRVRRLVETTIEPREGPPPAAGVGAAAARPQAG